MNEPAFAALRRGRDGLTNVMKNRAEINLDCGSPAIAVAATAGQTQMRMKPPPVRVRRSQSQSVAAIELGFDARRR